MMSKPTGRRGGFEVFDFDEDEELVQNESARIMKKFRKAANDDSSPVTKYTFLERFSVKESTPRRKGTAVVPIDCDSSGSKESKTGRKGYTELYFSGCKSGSRSPQPREKTPSSRSSCCIVDKDEGKHSGDSSFPASTSSLTDSKSSEQSMESDVRSWNSDTVHRKVVVTPDSIMYEKIYCTDSILTFTPNTIKLVGCFIDKNKETSSLEWPVTIIHKIESQWCQDVETAVIKIYFRSEDTASICENGSSGASLLKFTVYDSTWSQGEEAIKLLDAKYKALWNVIYDIDSVGDDNELLGTNRTLETDDCLNGEASSVLVFPKGERDAVSIGLRDMELLQPQTFINDTIIDFYMKYLMTQIPQKERNRFYIFNSFFFRKLADLDKGTNNKSERQEAFQRVRKWTRNVNLFEKDYIFVPVNFSLHWSLIIICHPGQLINTEGSGPDDSSKCTCILHMDSLRGCHRGLRNLFQSYLKEELSVRQSVTTEDLALKVSDIPFISLEVPQQQNSFDCGLFLLHYVECFLQHASDSFNPRSCIYRDWFPPGEVFGKRSHIRELIQKLLQDDSDHNKEGDLGNPHFSTVSPDRDCDQTNSGTKSEETCSFANISAMKDLASDEHNLITDAMPVNCGTTSGCLTSELPENTCRTVSKPCSEVAEKFSDCIASCPDRDSRILSEKANEPSTSYPSKILSSLRISWKSGLSRLQGMKNRRNTYCNGSPNSSSVAEVHDDGQNQPTADLNNSKSRSTSVEDLEHCVVQDSEDEAVDAVSCSNISRAIVPFPSSSERTSLVDCVVEDSESDGELEPESEPKPNNYDEKDVIDIEDSSKSFKIIDLSNEADDEENIKPPPKRPRRRLHR